ncbi:MAG: PEGA domain-containing protein [Planctomycetaceae bacterium]|jgi:hypothetical protein|nr:PEGA domain-containing protein [Planctomycetaceae bacterium]
MRTVYKKIGYLLIFLSLILLFFNGCVRRRMTVRSNPPGATVYLDSKEIGRTPFSTNFDFYGKREFRIVKQGYETKTVLLPVPAPWYELPGIDFISEVLLPGKLTDHKYYEFDMRPEQITPTHELVGRAEDLRRTAHAEGTLQINNGSILPMPVTPTTSPVNSAF